MGRVEYVVPIFLCLAFGVSGIPRVDPLVDTKVGLIKGLAASDGQYSMFLGIPYATVDPLNPFGPSIPHSGFETTFNAIDDSAVCPQREEYNNTLVGTLDCLHLNVYVPNTASSRNLRPVMVYIHGGGFVNGFARRFALGPKYLVKHDVILVTLNYRLGAYGFLCPGIPEVPGNQGIKDQLIALRWIKDNIGAFGGDTNQITLFGESAGGVSVDLHLIYSGENLFNKIILQSGTALLPFAFRDSEPTGPLKLAQHLGYATDDVIEALAFLRTVDPNLIVAATTEANVITKLCVEKEYENVERYITSHPSNLKIPRAKTIPILVGFNDNERGDRYDDVAPEDFHQVDAFSGVSVLFNFDDEYLADVVTLVRQFYIGDEDISVDVRTDITKFVSDFDFYYPTYRSIKKYFESGATDVYHYMFSYDGDRNYVKRKSNRTELEGALHADELSYLFDFALFDETPTEADQLTIDRITTLWTNFAKYSNPIPEVSDILTVQWPRVTKEVLHYLDIDSDVTVRKRPFNDRIAFWELFFQLNQSFLKDFEN